MVTQEDVEQAEATVQEQMGQFESVLGTAKEQLSSIQQTGVTIAESKPRTYTAVELLQNRGLEAWQQRQREEYQRSKWQEQATGLVGEQTRNLQEYIKDVEQKKEQYGTESSEYLEALREADRADNVWIMSDGRGGSYRLYGSQVQEILRMDDPQARFQELADYYSPPPITDVIVDGQGYSVRPEDQQAFLESFDSVSSVRIGSQVYAGGQWYSVDPTKQEEFLKQFEVKPYTPPKTVPDPGLHPVEDTGTYTYNAWGDSGAYVSEAPGMAGGGTLLSRAPTPEEAEFQKQLEIKADALTAIPGQYLGGIFDKKLTEEQYEKSGTVIGFLDPRFQFDVAKWNEQMRQDYKKLEILNERYEKALKDYNEGRIDVNKFNANVRYITQTPEYARMNEGYGLNIWERLAQSDLSKKKKITLSTLAGIAQTIPYVVPATRPFVGFEAIRTGTQLFEDIPKGESYNIFGKEIPKRSLAVAQIGIGTALIYSGIGPKIPLKTPSFLGKIPGFTKVSRVLSPVTTLSVIGGVSGLTGLSTYKETEDLDVAIGRALGVGLTLTAYTYRAEIMKGSKKLIDLGNKIIKKGVPLTDKRAMAGRGGTKQKLVKPKAKPKEKPKTKKKNKADVLEDIKQFKREWRLKTADEKRAINEYVKTLPLEQQKYYRLLILEAETGTPVINEFGEVIDSQYKKAIEILRNKYAPVYEFGQPTPKPIPKTSTATVTEQKLVPPIQETTIGWGENIFSRVGGVSGKISGIGIGVGRIASLSDTGRIGTLQVGESRFREGILGDSKSKIKVLEDQKSKLRTKLFDLQRDDTILDTQQETKQKSILRTKIAQLEQQIQQQYSIQDTATGLISGLATGLTTATGQITSTITGFAQPFPSPTITTYDFFRPGRPRPPRPPRPKPPKPPKPFGFILPEFGWVKSKRVVKPTKKTRKKGYLAYGKSRGKWKKINKVPVTKARAKDIGSYMADRSLSASFKIAPTTKKARKAKLQVPKGYYKRTEKKFRDYRVTKGKRVPMKNTWIEKSKRRLDTKAEVNKITLAKQIAKSRKKFKPKKSKQMKGGKSNNIKW